MMMMMTMAVFSAVCRDDGRTVPGGTVAPEIWRERRKMQRRRQWEKEKRNDKNNNPGVREEEDAQRRRRKEEEREDEEDERRVLDSIRVPSDGKCGELLGGFAVRFYSFM